MRRWALVSLVVVAVATAGCRGEQPGTAVPTQAGTSGQSTGDPTTSEAGVPLPERPRDLQLDGADPCELITPDKRQALLIDRPPEGGPQTDGPLAGSPSCHFRSSTEEYGFLITSSTAMGAAEYFQLIKQDATLRVIEVGGFPAIRHELDEPRLVACFVELDVADGQMLAVQFSQIAATKPLPMETLCSKAVEVAEAALTTLQGQR